MADRMRSFCINTAELWDEDPAEVLTRLGMIIFSLALLTLITFGIVAGFVQKPLLTSSILGGILLCIGVPTAIIQFGKRIK